MVEPGISVIIPVGPNPAYLAYLPECIDSVESQLGQADQIVLIDDQAYLGIDSFPSYTRYAPVGSNVPEYRSHVKWSIPWLSGCAHAWNYGVALAGNEYCLLMGSDDKLFPDCLETLRKTITHPDCNPLAYYNLTCQLQDGTITDVFNNAAMVSKSLWKLTGGFPLSAAVGAPDALLISIMIKHLPHLLMQVDQGVPHYWVRQHDQQDTLRQAGVFHWEVIQIRDKETARWQKPEWTDRV